ncbi:unnamed protein product [Triticum turgidum subsp. durum]|uniref:NB-ARC domain-containing protein n=1 Tax=Triticum turgidum subsp. durum TaxID=4567 RepID=A0A9R0R6A6_TRITD|nr:unnamed protein product [Triticum turgidum subsp. durum]
MDKFLPLIRLTVPQGCTPNLLFKEVLERLEEQREEEENADCGQPYECNSNLTDKIRHLLGNKKYLLVLGGICSKAMLNCLKESLPDNKNGSGVILTFDGEDEELAWHADTMNREGISGIHQLSRLNKERSGELFRSRAFKTEKSDEEGYKSKYDQIVYDITGGYPLAIVVLGGLLRFKERPGQLEAVLQQLRPAPGMEAVLQVRRPGPGMEAEGGKDCMHCHISPPPTQVDLSSTRTAMERVFWASFEDLANDLKSCFLYFAAFSKNIGFYADEVVRMWIGEGFIKPQKGKTIEELGHGYLKELVLRCLVDILEMVDGDIKIIKVHPRLHVFLQSEVREAGFVELHDTNDVFVSPSVRRLSFRSFDRKKVKFTKKLPKLRSFICRVEESEPEQRNDRFYDLNFLRGSKFLRLIYVNGLRLCELPHDIGKMIHLRYLYVRCKDLKELPRSIKGLLNLQTLDIRETLVDKIDPGFWKIKTLRHVLAEQLTLPKTLDLEDELEELQTLHGVKPPGGEWNQENCPLRKMTKLQSLHLLGIEHGRHGAALESALKEMCLLVDLSLQGDVIPQCVFTGEGLQYLETVQLDGSMRWPHVSSNVCKDRPNLAQLILKKSNDAELEKMGFTSFGTVPGVYRRPSKQGESAAANQNAEHKDEASSSAKEQPEFQGEEAEAIPEDRAFRDRR